MFEWIIEDKLAQGPLPSLSELENLGRIFNTLVLLTMPHENPLGGEYIELLESYGFNVIYAPINNSYPPQLFDLLKLIVRIDEEIKSGRRVLVNCKGGMGRSGTVTAAYLVYNGRGVYEAIREVRHRVPGSVENKGQISMVEVFSTLINMVGADLLKRYCKILEDIKDRVQVAHASKTVQFTVELLGNLFVGDAMNREILLESLIHFHEQSYRDMIAESLGLGNIEGSSSTLVTFAHELDYLMDGRVVLTQYDDMPDAIELSLLCEQDCTPIVERATSKRYLLRDLIDKEVRIKWGNYLDYV